MTDLMMYLYHDTCMQYDLRGMPYKIAITLW